VEIGAADSAVGDLDVDVVFFPEFGLERAPLHFAVHAIGRVAKPAFELVWSGHVEEIYSSEKWQVLIQKVKKRYFQLLTFRRSSLYLYSLSSRVHISE
jgi:hypothetical protein